MLVKGAGRYCWGQSGGRLGAGLRRSLSPHLLLQFQRPLSKADAPFLGLTKQTDRPKQGH